MVLISLVLQNLKKDSILGFVGNDLKNYEKAKKFLATKTVLKLNFEPNTGYIRSNCESTLEPIEQWISFDKIGKLTDAHCNCTKYENFSKCKHIVAILLQFKHKEQELYQTPKLKSSANRITKKNPFFSSNYMKNQFKKKPGGINKILSFDSPSTKPLNNKEDSFLDDDVILIDETSNSEILTQKVPSKYNSLDSSSNGNELFELNNKVLNLTQELNAEKKKNRLLNELLEKKDIENLQLKQKLEKSSKKHNKNSEFKGILTQFSNGSLGSNSEDVLLTTDSDLEMSGSPMKSLKSTENNSENQDILDARPTIKIGLLTPKKNLVIQDKSSFPNTIPMNTESESDNSKSPLKSKKNQSQISKIQNTVLLSDNIDFNENEKILNTNESEKNLNQKEKPKKISILDMLLETEKNDNFGPKWFSKGQLNQKTQNIQKDQENSEDTEPQDLNLDLNLIQDSDLKNNEKLIQNSDINKNPDLDLFSFLGQDSDFKKDVNKKQNLIQNSDINKDSENNENLIQDSTKIQDSVINMDSDSDNENSVQNSTKIQDSDINMDSNNDDENLVQNSTMKVVNSKSKDLFSFLNQEDDIEKIQNKNSTILDSISKGKKRKKLERQDSFDRLFLKTQKNKKRKSE